MSNPLRGFANLSLQIPMAPKKETRDQPQTLTEQERARILMRKIKTRDIIASFNREKLPAEICEDVFEGIGAAEILPVPTSLTIQGDFEGTLLQRCAYDEDLFNRIQSFQRPEQLALLTWQKLRRRLPEEFKKYDELVEDVELGVAQIADNFRLFEAALRQDHQGTTQMTAIASGDAFQAAFVEVHSVFIQALSKILDRHFDLAGESSLGQSGTNNLYHHLVVAPPGGKEPFMIGLLEHKSISIPDVLSGSRGLMAEIAYQLHQLGAPIEYQERFSVVLSRIRTAAPAISSAPASAYSDALSGSAPQMPWSAPSTQAGMSYATTPQLSSTAATVHSAATPAFTPQLPSSASTMHSRAVSTFASPSLEQVALEDEEKQEEEQEKGQGREAQSQPRLRRLEPSTEGRAPERRAAPRPEPARVAGQKRRSTQGQGSRRRTKRETDE